MSQENSPHEVAAESSLAFLRKKFRHYSFGKLVRGEIEGTLLWLFNSFPGLIGFALRNVVFKILFKKLDGFAWVQPRVTFVNCENLKVGKMFGCNSGTYINAIGGVRMGDYVLIGSNVTISSGRHPIDGRMPEIFRRSTIPEAIVIEDDVWIAAGAVILPGVTLRRGTVVGANAVVTKSTSEYSVVIGAPATHRRFRYETEKSG